MGTIPGAFYDTVTAKELSFILSSLPSGFVQFDNLVDGTHSGAEVLLGTAANDIFKLGPGDAVGSGGAGFDAVESSSSVTLPADVESAKLTGSADANISGNGLDNILVGNDGANLIAAGDGDDLLIGYHDDKGKGQSDDHHHDDGGQDTLYGGIGDDALFGGSDGDKLFGDEGNDLIVAETGGSEDHGRSGDHHHDHEGEGKGQSGDHHHGSGSGDHGSLGDYLDGGVGSDTLIGGAGDDTLFGGQDLVLDILKGGAGADTFVMKNAQGGVADVIQDFSPKSDVIDLSGTGAAGLGDLNLTNDSDGVIVEVKTDGTVFKILGHDASDVSAKWFHF